MAVELITLHEPDDLTHAIAQKMKLILHVAAVERFADSEIRIVLENPSYFAEKTVIIIQSTNAPALENIFGLAFLAHELRNAQAKKIISVIPYFGYSRQEKSIIPDKPGSVWVIAQLLQNSGIDCVASVELHAPIIESFFKIPVHNIILINFMAHHIKQHVTRLDNVCLVAPDSGMHAYVQELAKRLDVGMLLFTKERYDIDKTRITGRTGECRGTRAIIIDDIIDTGTTALHVCKELQMLGFQEIIGYFVHPVFSGNSLEYIERSSFTKLFVSNTINLSIGHQKNKITVFDISSILVDTINHLLDK